jgi:glycolate oxidase FAD binding subunit
MTSLKPGTADQARDAVRWALSEESSLAVVAGGTKRALGRPVQAQHTLDVSGLAGIDLYEPEELVISAAPGTPLAELEAALAGHNQQLAFEPPDLGPLLGAAAAPAAAAAVPAPTPEAKKGRARGRKGGGTPAAPAPPGPTLGGIVACNLSGPRRIKAGAARDHLLGLEGVSGRGDAFKTGGRVFKNVTGYDLSKLMTGSFGTLAVFTRLTLKVLPRPELERTVLLLGLDGAAAVRALTAALETPYEVAGAAHLPAAAAARSGVPEVAGAGAAVTAIRVEGFGPSVAYRCDRLMDLLRGSGEMDELDSEASAAFWREVRDVHPFVAGDRTVWRLSVPPADGAAVAAAAGGDGAEHILDWGGGLLWLALPPADDAGAARVRAALAGRDGHATLIRAPEPVRAAVEVFQPQPAALAALTARIKDSFDPRRILNPGRMYAGV